MDLIFCHAFIYWGGCARQVDVDSHNHCQNEKNALDDASFKNSKICLLLANTCQNSVSLVFSSHSRVALGIS
jgi:hypothetical protein